MGELMRRYWHSIGLLRDASGTSLLYGTAEDRSISCSYHDLL